MARRSPTGKCAPGLDRPHQYKYPEVPGESRRARRERLVREYWERHADRRRAQQSVRMQEYRHRKSEHAKRVSEKSRLKTSYGLTFEALHQMFENQEGLCAICSRLMRFKGPHGHDDRCCIDHDHRTGKVRGLLCRRCNLGIGHMQDSRVVLRNAAGYLG